MSLYSDSNDEEENYGEMVQLIELSNDCSEDREKCLKDTSIPPSESSIPEEDTAGLASTKLRELGILLLVNIVYFLSVSVDTLLLPFFTHETVTRGLTEVHSGFIFGVYDLAKFAISPFCAEMVSSSLFVMFLLFPI